MREGFKRLLKVRHRLPIGRTCQRLCPSLPTVEEHLLPHLAAQGMMRQLFDLLGQALGIALFHRLHNAGMQRPTPLVQQAP